MSRLFIELYLDADVDIRVAGLVRARRVTAITTVEAGNRGMSDTDQLAYATSQGRAFLTHNRVDFETLAQAWAIERRRHTGISVATRRPPYEIARRLMTLLNRVTTDEMYDQIRSI